jgi:hypothetical protein
MPALERWWAQELGDPATAGSQDDVRYAFFPEKRRLLVRQNGIVRTYDSDDHRIAGVAQTNSQNQSLVFLGKHGPVNLDELKLLSSEP